MLEVPCDPGDALWEMSDADLLDRLSGDLDALGLPIRQRVLHVFSSHAAQAYPLYDLGYAAVRARLLAAVDVPGNVYAVGRQGLFRYVFMDTAMEMGWQAGDDIAAGRSASSSRTMAVDRDVGLVEAAATTA
jgi:protoporphyrinogen oxidase